MVDLGQVQEFNPREYRKRLNEKAKRAGERLGISTGSALQRFYIARLLARVFHRDPAGWVLKGGQALLARYSDARHSTDVDLLHPAVGGPDEGVERLVTLVEQDLGDLLTSKHRDTTFGAGDGQATTVRFNLSVGTTSITTVSVDLVMSHVPIGEYKVKPIDAVIDLSGLDRAPGLTVWPDALLYPVADHLADKICAMIETHDGNPSTRHRDLVDLLLITARESVDGGVAHRALHTEITRRQARSGSVELVIPDRFHVPAEWADGYAKSAVVLPGHLRSLAAAEEHAALFVDPLLGRAAPGRWCPVQHGWQPS